MSSDKKRVADKLARMRRDTDEVGAADQSAHADLVEQLAHEESGKPDFAAIAGKLKERQEAEKKPTFQEGTTKFTIYVDNDIAEAFKAMCVNRGDQRRYATEAFEDFIIKKTNEMGL